MNTYRDNNEFPGGVCLISRDKKETICFCNDYLIHAAGWKTREEFYSWSGGHFQGLMTRNAYIPLQELYGADASADDRVAVVHLCARDRNNASLFLDGLLVKTMAADGTPAWGLYVMKGRGDRSYLNSLSGFMNSDDFYQAMLKMAQEKVADNTYDTYVPTFINLTNFKMYNAVHGWKEGNRLIAYLGASIRREFPQALVCHVGGDQFSFAIYDSHMGVSMYDRTHMMRSFEKALKDGEFEVYFQPQIRTCTGKVCGLEALSRWHDSEKGLLMPGEYIPMLEETGLISRLDYYVAEKAIQRIVWHLKTYGRALPVSINLSRVDFDVSDPVMEVERLVQVYGCPHHLLHIEVTESALVQDYGRLKQGLHDFQEAGYTCWLDDFGSAWSSLNALHNFHFDELKMDMGFMRNFNSESQSIVKSIVVMSRTLGIHTLTEGVETKEQVDFLSSLGCEKMQGYYYGKPMPGSQYISWLKGKNLEEELPEEAELLDRAGFIFLDGDAPAALFLFTAETIRVIRENEAFAAWKPCREAGYDCCGELWKDILHVARGAIKTGADGRLALKKDGNPARLRVRILEQGKGMALGKAELLDL